MAKSKTRSNVAEPTPGVVPSRDVHQRLNFLYQASVLLATAVQQPSPGSQADRKGKRKAGQQGDPDLAFLIPTQVGGVVRRIRAGGDEEREPAMAVDAPTQQGSSTCTTAAPDLFGGIRPPDPSPFEQEMKLQHENHAAATKETKKWKKRRAEITLGASVSRMLVRTMREVAKKGTIRMDPSVKRTLCRKCSSVLIPGVNCTVRIRPSGPHAHLIVKKCANCLHSTRLPQPPLLPSAAVAAAPELNEPAPEEEPMEDVQVEPEPPQGKKKSRREARKARQARQPTFFERDGHVTFVRAENVVRTT